MNNAALSQRFPLLLCQMSSSAAAFTLLVSYLSQHCDYAMLELAISSEVVCRTTTLSLGGATSCSGVHSLLKSIAKTRSTVVTTTSNYLHRYVLLSTPCASLS